jgi:hypothetical protein
MFVIPIYARWIHTNWFCKNLKVLVVATIVADAGANTQIQSYVRYVEDLKELKWTGLNHET